MVHFSDGKRQPHFNIARVGFGRLEFLFDGGDFCGWQIGDHFKISRDDGIRQRHNFAVLTAGILSDADVITQTLAHLLFTISANQ